MKGATRKTALAFSSVLVILGASEAATVPITASYVDTTDCDFHGPTNSSYEIGDILQLFPTGASFLPTVNSTSQVVCVGDDGLPNDWEVKILNTSPNNYQDLFLVADEGIAESCEFAFFDPDGRTI